MTDHTGPGPEPEAERGRADRDADVADHDIAHPRFAACYDLLPQGLVLKSHREYLARGLSGRVLEIGAGNGAMFPFVVDGAPDSDELEYHAIEPDPHMRRRATKRARETGLAVDLRDARAESLPYPDDAFDVVVSGMVFCTVQDPEAALAEVTRALRPGGEFRFLEHVHADGWRATGQDLLNPLWERAAGGCQLNRDTIDLFGATEDVAVEEIERVQFGVFPVTPFVRGTLRRRRERRSLGGGGGEGLGLSFGFGTGVDVNIGDLSGRAAGLLP